MPTVPKPRIPELPKYPKCHIYFSIDEWRLATPNGTLLYRHQKKNKVMEWANQRGVDFYYA